MSEAEILSQIQMGRYNIGFMASQIIAVHFALVVAIFFFLHKASMTLKVIAHALYSVGYAALLSLYVWEVRYMAALETSLAQLSVKESLSSVGEQMLAKTNVMDWVQSFAPWLIFTGAWVMITVLMFFPLIMRPEDATPAKTQ